MPATPPLILTELCDGSYLSVLGYGKLKVRIIEAWVTITWADGTTTREQWRLITCPDARPDRISFTVALQTAADQVIAAVGIIIAAGDRLVGGTGQAVLDDLLPDTRNRGKARTKKNPTSKYGLNAGNFPQTSLNYTINTTVTIMEEGLTARSKRARPARMQS